MPEASIATTGLSALELLAEMFSVAPHVPEVRTAAWIRMADTPSDRCHTATAVPSGATARRGTSASRPVTDSAVGVPQAPPAGRVAVMTR